MKYISIFPVPYRAPDVPLPTPEADLRVSISHLFPPKRRPRIPVRSEALRRRRMIAAAGLLPPNLAWYFRPSEQTVMAIIADAIRAKGYCDLFIVEICERACVSRKTVQNTIRMAQQMFLLSCELRPVKGRGKKHRANVLRCVSLEWREWLKKRKGRVTEGWSGTPVHPYKNLQEQEGLSEGMPSLSESHAGQDSRWIRPSPTSASSPQTL